jgi:hypothetical protein
MLYSIFYIREVLNLKENKKGNYIEIKEINMISLVKAVTFVTFFISILYSFVAWIDSIINPGRVPVATIALLAAPFIFAVMGLIFSCLVAFFYNIFAGKFGGLKIRV